MPDNLIWAEEINARAAQGRLTENLQLRERGRYLDTLAKEAAVAPKARNFLLDFGGYADFDYIDYHNDDNNREVRDVYDAEILVDSRIWVKGIVRHQLGEKNPHHFEHVVFAQFRDLYMSSWPKEELLLGHRDDNVGPRVDLLYLDLDLQYATFRSGRQYLNLGQGIALADIYDALKLTLEFFKFKFESFVAKTVPFTENIDFSVPGFDKKSDRKFVGAQTIWTPKDNLSLYNYFLIQHDDSKPNPDDGQDFAYHSQYWSLGGIYQAIRGVSLWGEYIFETGSSAVYGEDARHPVLAHGLDLGASYTVPCWMKPEVSVEYAFGSGDTDRSSVTNTEGGNLNGYDHNFLPLGFFPNGYALAPTLSNIQILRAGVSLKPFEKIWSIRKLEIISNGYAYWKAVAKGGVYDIDATQPSSDIGREIDFAVAWPVFSDLFISVSYGLFFPGAAFPAESNDRESNLSLSASFSF